MPGSDDTPRSSESTTMQPDHADERAELNAFLQHLLDSGSLEGPAAGIARQVMARGEKSLSERQEWVFDTQVRAKYLYRTCRLCENLIPLGEVPAALENGDLCASCAVILGGPAESGT
jgi:hypothetical protein